MQLYHIRPYLQGHMFAVVAPFQPQQEVCAIAVNHGSSVVLICMLSACRRCERYSAWHNLLTMATEKGASVHLRFSTAFQLLHSRLHLCNSDVQANLRRSRAQQNTNQNECVAENGSSVETRPGIAESFAPALSGFTSEMQSELQGAQKENRPPLSQGKSYIP